MNLTTFITENYPAIKQTAYGKAFKMYVDKNDLLSLLNEKLVVYASRNDFVVEHPNQFWVLINQTIYHTACDLKRRQSPFCELLEDVINLDSGYRAENNLTAKNLVSAIITELNSYGHDKTNKAIAEVLIHGCKYEDVARQMDFNLGTLKGAIWKFRQKVFKKYGDIYKEVILN